jgi:hypothetical protein
MILVDRTAVPIALPDIMHGSGVVARLVRRPA